MREFVMGTNDGSRNFSANCDLERSGRCTDRSTGFSMDSSPGPPSGGPPWTPAAQGKAGSQGSCLHCQPAGAGEARKWPSCEGRGGYQGPGSRCGLRVSTMDSGRPECQDFLGKRALKTRASAGKRGGSSLTLTLSFPSPSRISLPSLDFSDGSSVDRRAPAGGVGVGRSPGAQVGTGASVEMLPWIPAPPPCGPWRLRTAPGCAGRGLCFLLGGALKWAGGAPRAWWGPGRGEHPGAWGGGTCASLDAGGRGRESCERSPAPAPLKRPHRLEPATEAADPGAGRALTTCLAAPSQAHNLSRVFPPISEMGRGCRGRKRERQSHRLAAPGLLGASG